MKNRARKMHQITLNPIYKTESNRLQAAKIKKELKKHSQETWKNRLLSLNTQDNSFWNIQNFFKNKRVDIPALHTASGIAITDDQKANLIAKTLKDNFTENTRPELVSTTRLTLTSLQPSNAFSPIHFQPLFPPLIQTRSRPTSIS
ncbi:hypothetical protein TNCV_3945071 [Trichonephila clavipes]|nr:hypothetical protein TNCV_3945071 [Trichonephila clavipes]